MDLGSGAAAQGSTPEPAPATYTPKHLADKILRSKSALEGERKQVTVLFADVKGSMDLAEALDPEALHRIMDRFFEILAEGVHRFEGTINQYTGDGIMALFGAPIAHEDHAQRACLAALALRDGLRAFGNELRLERGISFATRMGLHSGDVVVGKIGDDLRMDYTAQGQTVNLAARMEQIAEPGEIYLTETTARLVQGYMALDDLGAANVKGATAPIGTFALRSLGSVRTRLDASRARGLSRFVGRSEESAILGAALERAREGQGSVIGVMAEAGTGKSRLCFEFVERARAQGVQVNEGYAVAHGQNVPLLPILQLMRNAFGVTDQDTAQAAREKVAGRLLLRDQSIAELLPFLFALMRIPDPKQPAPELGAEERERLLADMGRRLLHGRGSEPAIMLLEDLHWFDPESQSLLAHIVAGVPGSRVVLLLTFRPGTQADWMQKSYYQQLALQPLGAGEIRQLVASLLGADPSLGDLAARLQDRSGGNPFFIEELVQTLVEAGDLEGETGRYRLTREIDDLRMPATVQAVLAARIDRLPEREKRVLQAASVIGRTVPEPLLRAIAELPAAELTASLRALVTSEFLYEEALYPEAEYAFKHALTQEVAYASQLGDRRARLHAALAGAIETSQPDRTDENASLLGHHLEQAGEALEASRWYARAASQGAYMDFLGTKSHWERVRDLLGGHPTGPEAVTLALRARTGLIATNVRLGFSDEEFAKQIHEGRELARRAGDEVGLARVLVAAAYAAMVRADTHQHTLAREAHQLATDIGDAAIQAAAAGIAGMSEIAAGTLAEAGRLFEETIRLAAGDLQLGAELTAGLSPLGLARALRASVLIRRGQLAQGYEEAFRVARQAQRDGHFAILMAVMAACIQAEEHSGTSGEAVPLAEAAFRWAEKSGARGPRIQTGSFVARAYLAAGEPVRALELLATLFEMSRGTHSVLWYMLLTRGQAELATGRLEAAAQSVEAVLAEVRRTGQRLGAAEALITRASIQLEIAEGAIPDAVQDDLAEARRILDQAGTAAFEPTLLEVEARAAEQQGDLATARVKLEEALRAHRTYGATGHAERLERAIAASA
jgi:class 3 adenylate cyclase